MGPFGWLASASDRVQISNRGWGGSNLPVVSRVVCGWGHFQQWGGPTLSDAWVQILGSGSERLTGVIRRLDQEALTFFGLEHPR